MKTSTLAIGIASLISLAACGGNDNNEDTAVSGPSPAPAPGPTPGPAPAPGITGADIDMTQAFSQTLNCYYGEKPYYDTSITGPWTVAFDGDLLSLISTVGNQTFGDRFSSSAPPPAGLTREDDATSATLSTFIGGSGSGGNIFFTKTIDGTVSRAGHNQFGGVSPRRDTVECGSDRDNQWLALPTSTPFSALGEDFNWTDSQTQLNCAVRPAGTTTFGVITPASLVTVSNGPLIVNDGATRLFGVQAVDEPDRTETVPVDSPRIGATIWESVSDTDGSKVSVSIMPSNRMLRNVRATLADGTLTSCAPSPLDPTF